MLTLIIKSQKNPFEIFILCFLIFFSYCYTDVRRRSKVWAHWLSTGAVSIYLPTETEACRTLFRRDQIKVGEGCCSPIKVKLLFSKGLQLVNAVLCSVLIKEPVENDWWTSFCPHILLHKQTDSWQGLRAVAAWVWSLLAACDVIFILSGLSDHHPLSGWSVIVIAVRSPERFGPYSNKHTRLSRVSHLPSGYSCRRFRLMPGGSARNVPPFVRMHAFSARIFSRLLWIISFAFILFVTLCLCVPVFAWECWQKCSFSFLYIEAHQARSWKLWRKSLRFWVSKK